MLTNQTLQTVKHLLVNAGNVVPGEKILILYDETTSNMITLFEQSSLDLKVDLKSLKIEIRKNHGGSISQYLFEEMKKTNLVIALLSTSIAHTKARLDFNSLGGRFLSMPDYTMEMLLDASLKTDFKSQLEITKYVTNILSIGKDLFVKSSNGTSLRMNITDRIGNCCPGFVDSDYLLGSPPDIESNISPIEQESNGTIVVDGSITTDSIGLLKCPVELTIKFGKITSFTSSDKYMQKVCQDLFIKIGDEKAYVLAECGIGLNPNARLTGKMLTDEGAIGSVHFGFGSNITVGGLNDVPFHLDFVIRKPSLEVDGEKLISDGNLLF